MHCSCCPQVARPRFIAADLAQTSLEEALSGCTDFDPKAKTVFTMEGLIYYLPPASAAALLASARKLSAPGSALAFDFLHADALEGRARPPAYRVTAQVRPARSCSAAGGAPVDEHSGVYVHLAVRLLAHSNLACRCPTLLARPPWQAAYLLGCR
jgi:hypothetical protein